MIHSMTGFGKAGVKSRYGDIDVEIRSLNHKYFEPSIKLPNGLASFEDRVKRMLAKDIKRGKVYLSINSEDKLKEIERISIDRDVARAYKRQLTGLKKSVGLKGDIKLEQFITLPGVISYEGPKADSSKVWPYVRKALAQALKELIKDRENEGRSLCRDIAKRAS